MSGLNDAASPRVDFRRCPRRREHCPRVPTVARYMAVLPVTVGALEQVVLPATLVEDGSDMVGADGLVLIVSLP